MVQVKVVAPIGLGDCDCGGGLAQHADDLPGPCCKVGCSTRTPVVEWRGRSVPRTAPNFAHLRAMFDDDSDRTVGWLGVSVTLVLGRR